MYQNTFSQNYIDEEVWSYVSPCENYTLIDTNHPVLKVLRYKTLDGHDSLSLYSTYEFTLLEPGFFSVKSKKKNSKFIRRLGYWKFKNNCSVYKSDKNGRIDTQKHISRDVIITHSETSGLDSLVYTTIYFKNGSNDSFCKYLYKRIYRNSTLIESWSKYAPLYGCDFTNGYYEIEKYLFSDSLKTWVTEFYKVDQNNHIQFIHMTFSLSTYNNNGQVISIKHYNNLKAVEPRAFALFFYENNRLARIESWYNNIMDEMVVFK